MPPIRFRSALAARIARLDRQKLNEAIAAGHYPCAPATQKGAMRLFSETDVIGLWVFARLLDMDMLPRRAGPLACEFQQMAARHPEEDRIVFVRASHGGGHFFTGSEYDPDIEKKGRYYTGLSPLAFAIEFHISIIRKLIADAIEEERSILGARDEDEDA